MLSLALAVVLSIELPVVSTDTGLDVPNPQRARVTVSADGIAFKPKRDTTEKKVTSLKAWAPPAKDLSGQLITPLAAAFDPAPGTGLEERVFSSEVEGWVELAIDRQAPMELVTRVLFTVGQRAGCLGVVVKTPSGEHVLRLFFPAAEEPPAELFTLAADPGFVIFAPSQKKSPRTVDAVRAAVNLFVKKGAKGKRALLPEPVGFGCYGPKHERLATELCWHPRVIFAATDTLAWGDAVPLVAAAHESVPDVVFASF